MKWFNHPTTIEELKKQYKKLACKYHPDVTTGSESDMKEINSEYDILFEKLKDIHKAFDGSTYTATKASTETADDFKHIIESLIRLNGINIEICGSWIWITGNTYPHRKCLKNLKFRFSKNKSAWYYHNNDYKKTSKKKFTLNEIRNMYGSKTVKTETQLQLQTI